MACPVAPLCTLIFLPLLPLLGLVSSLALLHLLNLSDLLDLLDLLLVIPRLPLLALLAPLSRLSAHRRHNPPGVCTRASPVHCPPLSSPSSMPIRTAIHPWIWLASKSCPHTTSCLAAPSHPPPAGTAVLNVQSSSRWPCTVTHLLHPHCFCARHSTPGIPHRRILHLSYWSHPISLSPYLPSCISACVHFPIPAFVYLLYLPMASSLCLLIWLWPYHQASSLHWAAYNNEVEVAELLIAKGANVNAKTKVFLSSPSLPLSHPCLCPTVRGKRERPELGASTSLPPMLIDGEGVCVREG